MEGGGLGESLFKRPLPGCNGVCTDNRCSDLFYEIPLERDLKVIVQPGTATAIDQQAADIALVSLNPESKLTDREALLLHVAFDPARDAFTAGGKPVFSVRESQRLSPHVCTQELGCSGERLWTKGTI